MSYKASNSQILRVWQMLEGKPFCKWMVSRVLCFFVPYFNSIKPVFTLIQPGQVEAKVEKRRAILNHIKSVHAIAMCNAAELVAGTCMDVSLSSDFRWIPVGMEVRYVKIAKTDLHAVCKLDSYSWDEPQDVVMPVSVYDLNGDEVLEAKITMRISHKRETASGDPAAQVLS
ncbi:DUF4442 domain-containing protein [bacterium]|nr:DUF4442 domain-containing protein [bacterium]